MLNRTCGSLKKPFWVDHLEIDPKLLLRWRGMTLNRIKEPTLKKTRTTKTKTKHQRNGRTMQGKVLWSFYKINLTKNDASHPVQYHESAVSNTLNSRSNV